MWRVELDAPGCDLPERHLHGGLGRQSAQALSVLSNEELERARAIVRSEARRRWVAARCFLRVLLGGYLEVDPRSLRFARGERGKPELLGEMGTRLRFNLARSGPVGVCALTRMCAVGVDVQLAPGPARMEAAARRAFGAPSPERHARRALGAERGGERLRGMPSERRERELLRAWVRLEAERKRLGVGLGASRLQISGPSPWMAEAQLAGGAACAVALALPPAELLWKRWEHFSDCWIYS